MKEIFAQSLVASGETEEGPLQTNISCNPKRFLQGAVPSGSCGNVIIINWSHTTITVINAEVCDSGLHGDLLLYNHMNNRQD